MNLKVHYIPWFKIKDEMLIELSIICNDAFWINLDLKEHYGHIIENDLVILIYDNNELIWFVWLKFHYNIVYLSAIIIKSKYQWLWIMKKVICDNILRFKKKYIFFNTNNDNLIKLFLNLDLEVFYWKEWYNEIKKIWLLNEYLLYSWLKKINNDWVNKLHYLNLQKDVLLDFMWSKVSWLDSMICLVKK